MKGKIALIFLLIILSNCSPKIRSSIKNTSFNKLNEETEVIIIENNTLPENSKYIGDLKIGDTGFTTDCGYNKIINDAKSEARKVGGNIVQIIEIKKPKKWGSTCYKIKAKIFRNLNSQILVPFKEKYASRNKTRLPIDANYAKVYIYRPKMTGGSFIGYKVRMDNDSVVCRVRNGEKCEVKISSFGIHKFWAEIESIDSVIIDVKKGQEYFIRCAMGMGVFVGNPDLNLIENHIGIKEFEEMKK